MTGRLDGALTQVKPAVIIGVGGSGDWVLREIKAAFLRVGKVPPSIQFIGIDTAPPADQISAAQPSSTGGGVGEDDSFSVPPLAPSETIRLNDNLKPMSEEVRDDAQDYPLEAVDEADGSLPHLRGWLRAGEYLQKLNDGTFILFNGASQLRQFGRAGLFARMQVPPEEPRATIRQAMLRVQPHLHDNEGIEVYVVSSVGGGTGAGMLIDVAHIARQEAKRIAPNSKLQAFLFTQSTFQAVLPQATVDDMAARAYATMREIDRFKSDWDNDYGYPIAHKPSAMDDPEARIDAALFENVYYVDGEGANNPLTRFPPTRAHYPMVAEAILSFVDDQAGSAAAAVVDNAWGKPHSVSAIGAYAVVLPVRAWLDKFELDLVEAAVDVIAPRGKSDEVLKSDDSDGQPGKSLAKPFLLKAGLTGPDRVEVTATGLPKRISAVVDAYQPGADPQLTGLLHSLSIGDFREALSVDGTGNTSLSLPVAPWLIDDNDNVVPRDVGLNVSWRPTNQVERCREILSDTQEKIDVEFGPPGDNQVALGNYRATLKRCQEKHREAFQKTLAAQVSEILNPDDTALATVLDARRARLGYVQSFLEALDATLSTFVNAMGDLKARQDLNRSKSNSTRNQHDSARSALQRAELRHRRLSWVLVTAIAVAIGAAFGLAVWAGGLATVAWAAATGVIVGIVIGLGLAQIKGEAYAAQRVYVDAANALLREYEEDALVQAMSATVTVMRQDLATLKASVDAWALAFRAPGTESLVQRIKSAQGKGRRARAEADESKVRRQLWNDEYLDRKYKEYVGEVPETRQPRKVAQLMQQLTWMPVVWSANGTGSLPALQLGDGREVMADTPSVVASAMETSLRAWARTVFDGFESTVDIVSFAREVFPGANGLKAFAQVLHQGISGPRLRLSRVSSTIQRQTYDWIDLNFLRIPETQGVGLDGQLWVNALIQEITDITPGLSMNIVHAKSSDPHSCALVYGRYRIHLFHEVVEYKKGQEKYINYSSSQLTRATLHCFPAEVNASEYEQKLKPILRQAQRPFDNKIVRLLEHPFRIKLFIRALCLGLIRSRMIPDGAMSKFEFVLRRSLEGDAHLKLTSVSSTYPDIYAAMRQFACGAQSVDANAGTKVDPIDFNKVRDLTMAELERRVPGRGVGERRRRLEVLRDALEVYRDGVASDDGQPNQRQSSPLERDLQIPRRLKNGEDIQGAADMTRDLRDLLHLMIREEVDVLNAQIAGIADSD